MNRPQTRWEIRKLAARAFERRNRSALSLECVREPENDETPLNRSEIAIGVREGLIAAGPAPAHLQPATETA